MNKLVSVYNKLPLPENWKFWIFTALIVKGLYVLYFISLSYSLEASAFGFNWWGSLAKAGGDAPSYLEPIENLLKFGSYEPDLRMPGYGWLYFLLRLILSPAASINVIVFLQLLLSSVSVYVLALIAKKIFNQLSGFYFTYFIYLISIFVSIFDYVIMTESFAVSSLIFAIFFYIRFSETRLYKFVFFSGILITWSIFLRPILLPLMLFLLILIIVNEIRQKVKLKHILIVSLLFILPFTVLDGAWTLRNYIKYKKIYPLQKSAYDSSTEHGFGKPIHEFVLAFGGNISFYQPNSQLLYFFPESQYFYSEIGTDKKMSLIPDLAYTRYFNVDSLLEVRKTVINLYDTTMLQEDKRIVEQELVVRINAFTNSIKKEKPYIYYVYSRFNVLRNLFFNTDYGYDGFIYKNHMKYYYLEYRIPKLIFSILYFFVFGVGTAGLLLMLFNKLSYCFKEYHILIFALAGYLTFAIPFVFLYGNNRYIVISYPFLILTSFYFLFRLINFIRRID